MTSPRIFWFGVLVFLLVLIYLLKPILMPFLVAMILAYLGDPLVDRLESLRINRMLAVTMVFVGFGLVVVLGGLVLVPVLVRELVALMRGVPEFIIWLQDTASPLLVSYFGIDPFDIRMDVLRTQVLANWQQTGDVVTLVLAEVTKSSVALVTWVATLILIPGVGFYLMRDWDNLVSAIADLIPRDVEGTVSMLTRECDDVLSAFLRGQLLVMLLLGCIYATGLYFVGLELAIVIGLLAGIASIVPYLGVIVGIFAAGLAALFQFQDMTYVAYVGVVFAIGQILEGFVLTPLLVGDRIGLHPVAVIFSILAGGQLFGFVGILLALPVAAVIMVFVRHAHDRYKDSDLYTVPETGEPPLSDSTRQDPQS